MTDTKTLRIEHDWETTEAEVQEVQCARIDAAVVWEFSRHVDGV